MSVSLEACAKKPKRNNLSRNEKRKIGQIAKIINTELQVAPAEKCHKSLERSIENHIKRMAVSTKKNVRIIKPPPNGLRILKNGEWRVPKNQSCKISEERAKKLFSYMPMTIPKSESSKCKIDGKTIATSKYKQNVTTHPGKACKAKIETDDDLSSFGEMCKTVMKKHSDFLRSLESLKKHVKDHRLEAPTAKLISRSISQMNDPSDEKGEPGKERKKTTIRAKLLRRKGSCPELPRKRKP